MTTTQPIRALLFDLDGTLLNTLADIAAAANLALSEAGFPTLPLSTFRLLVGAGAYRLMQNALPENHRQPEQIEKRLAAFNHHYAKVWHQSTRPYAGIVNALQKLQALGLPMAVLSNKLDAFTRECVAHYFAKIPFAHVQGYKEGYARKPDPASAIAIAAQMDIPPAECLFVGDSGIDMRTAVDAGMMPAGVLWGFRDRAELTATGARFFIEHPDELVALCAEHMPGERREL